MKRKKPRLTKSQRIARRKRTFKKLKRGLRSAAVIGKEVIGTAVEVAPYVAQSIATENPGPMLKYALSGAGRKRIGRYSKMIKKGIQKRKKRRRLR